MNFSGNIVNTQNSVNSVGTEPLNVTPQTAEPTQAVSRASEPSVNPIESDSATLTPAATMVQSAGDSNMSSDRIASIQSAIASGTYNVPASAVAEKIVENMLR